MFREVVKYGALGLGLLKYLKSPIDPNPLATLDHFLNNREANFLANGKKILAQPEHPYSQMFKMAGCSFADLEASVNSKGLQSTLDTLLNEGVYLSLDEFRGRKQIVRGGKHIPSTADSWINSAGKGPLQISSSGTSGKAHTTSYGIAAMKYGEASGRLMIEEWSGRNCELVRMGSILPNTTGFTGAISSARMGYPTARWFATEGTFRKDFHHRMATRAIIAPLRLAGAKIPYPTYLDPNDFSPVVRYIEQRKREGMPITISAFVSAVARVAVAAKEMGIDLTGTGALVTGEALTDVKRKIIEDAGIEVYPLYATSDFGGIGVPCRQMNTGNCVHVARASLVLTSRPFDDLWSDEQVSSLHVSSLLPFAPRILINVEIGDTAIIEKATCNCRYSERGYDQQVRNIASISKINAQGITIVASDIVRILEESLPARFGGYSGDYQLLEVETGPQTDMVLRVHPRAGVAAPAKVLEAFLAETKQAFGGSLAVLRWLHTDGVRVEVADPVLAQTGKFRAIRLLSAGIGEESAPASVAVGQSVRRV